MKAKIIKYFKTIFLLIMLTGAVKSQDLIVTNEGDSLNCKITKIKSNYIYFTFKHKEDIRSTLLSLNQVKYHQYNFFNVAEVPREKIVMKESYPNLRFSVSGGFGYRLAKVGSNIPSALTQYTKDLKSGYQFNVDGAYYFTEQIGAGFKYNIFKSKNEMNSSMYGFISDDMTISFIGPIFSLRLFNSSKTNCFSMDICMGYMGYNDNSYAYGNLKINGKTFGSTTDLSYDFAFSKNCAIFFQVSFLTGTMKQYELTQNGSTQTVKLDKSNYEGLTRADLSIGLRLNL